MSSQIPVRLSPSSCLNACRHRKKTVHQQTWPATYGVRWKRSCCLFWPLRPFLEVGRGQPMPLRTSSLAAFVSPLSSPLSSWIFYALAYGCAVLSCAGTDPDLNTRLTSPGSEKRSPGWRRDWTTKKIGEGNVATQRGVEFPLFLEPLLLVSLYPCRRLNVCNFYPLSGSK